MNDTFKVLANPWAAVDHKARPAGAVMLDPVDHYSGGGKYVGAKLEAIQVAPKQTRKVGKYVETTMEAQYDRVWVFLTAQDNIPAVNGGLSDYYLERVRHRELIPANAECAAAAGIPFVDPALVIAESRAARKSEWDAQHGDGSFESLQPGPQAVKPAENKPAAPQPEKAAASKEATQPTAAPKRAETSKE